MRPTTVPSRFLVLLHAVALRLPSQQHLPKQSRVPDMRPVASVLDLMLGQIDPAADFLWESVATISGPKGVEERQPRTDAEWAEVRYKALMVIEGANMLMVEGRQVAHPGQQLEEPGGATDYTPAQAQAEIDKDRASFVAFAACTAGRCGNGPDGHRKARCRCAARSRRAPRRGLRGLPQAILVSELADAARGVTRCPVRA